MLSFANDSRLGRRREGSRMGTGITVLVIRVKSVEHYLPISPIELVVVVEASLDVEANEVLMCSYVGQLYTRYQVLLANLLLCRRMQVSCCVILFQPMLGARGHTNSVQPYCFAYFLVVPSFVCHLVLLFVSSSSVPFSFCLGQLSCCRGLLISHCL